MQTNVRDFPEKNQTLRWIALWIINSAAIFLLPYLMSSVTVESFGSALLAALVLGLINALIKPALLILTLPVTVLTLGAFIFVLNGLLFWMVSGIVPGFQVAGFWSAFGGAILYSVISWSLSTLILKE
jgi:putative membrane protein